MTENASRSRLGGVVKKLGMSAEHVTPGTST